MSGKIGFSPSIHALLILLALAGTAGMGGFPGDLIVVGDCEGGDESDLRPGQPMLCEDQHLERAGWERFCGRVLGIYVLVYFGAVLGVQSIEERREAQVKSGSDVSL